MVPPTEGQASNKAHSPGDRRDTPADDAIQPMPEHGAPASPPSAARAHRYRGRGQPPQLASLLVFLVLGVLMPALAVGMLATWQAESQARAAAEARLRDTAHALELAVNQEIDRDIATAQVFAGSSTLDPAVIDTNPTEFDARVRMVAHQLGLAIDIARRDGSRVMSTRAPLGAPLARVNGIGNIQRVFATGQTIVGNVILGSVAKRLVVPVVAPIFDAKGKVALVAEASFAADHLHDLLELEQLPRGSFVAVIDANHIVVARTDDLHATMAGRPVLPAVEAELNSASSLFRVRERDGAEQDVAAWAMAAAPDWTVAVSEPASVIDGAWRKPLLLFGGGSVVVCALGIVLVVLVARKVLVPLRLLRGYADTIVASGGRIPADHASAAELPPASVAELEALRLGFAAAETAQQQRHDAERRANVALTGREAELRTLFEVIPIGLARCGFDGRVLDANSEALHIVGLTRDDLLAGRVHRDQLTPPEFHSITRRVIGEAIADPFGRGRPFEKEFVRPDGTRVPVLLTVAILDRQAEELAVFFLDLSEIRRRDAWLRLMVDRAPAAIALFDADMRYLAVSQRYIADLRVTGETPQSLVGRSHYEVFPEVPERWRDIHRRVLAGETLASDEEPFPRPDGRTDWMRWEMTPWRHTDGKVGGAVLFAEVITLRREAEAALAESEARMLDLVATAREGIVVASEDGTMVSVNPAGVRLFGYASESEMVGRKLQILMTDDIGSRHDGYLAGHRAAGPAKAIGAPGRELTGRRKDGSTFPLEISVSSFTTGPSRYFTGVLRDVSDRKRAEDALRESQERLLRIIEDAPIPIMVHNEDGEVLHISKAWTEVSGYRHEDIPTIAAWTARAYGARAARIRAMIARAYTEAADAYVGGELAIRTAHGTQRWWDFNAAAAGRDANGRRMMVSMAVDITDRHETEVELTRDNAALENLVAERTRDLEATQARLAQAAKMEALGRLAGGVAHDFNNVLQAVQGGIAMAARRLKTKPETAETFLNLAIAATERGALVTGRLLAFARRGELSAEPVDTDRLFQELSVLLSHTLGPAVTLLTEVETCVPPVLADAGQLESVLVNLVNNAKDALPDGRGTIRITASAGAAGSAPELRLASGEYVRIAITDDGCGMSADVLARVTEPFFTTKPRGKGTGLGLAMARGFAEQSGGALAIRSAVGQGTRVTLWLPASREEMLEPGAERDAERRAGQGAEPDPAPSRARPVSVLLVDDEQPVRLVLAETLSANGHNVTEAPDAAAALARVDAGMDVDVLVTDLSMPGPMDGLALLREVRNRRPRLPVVLITGHAGDAGPDSLGAVRASGPFTILHKPFDDRALVAGVEAVLAET